ncbi:hypothetical protein B9G55_11465 [Saccharibacillus sp. O16]|nr:hypothetical protein B9G55_11465 [Saccharibacillus sp. O16]
MRRREGKSTNNKGTKFRHSLMARYLMLIGFAIFLLPFIMVVVLLFYLGYTYLVWQPAQPKEDPNKYVSTSKLTEDWHKLAASLDGASAQEIVRAVGKFRRDNPLVTVAAVDEQGQTLIQEPQPGHLPKNWTAGRMAEYMKRADLYNTSTFSVVAFIGEGKDEDKDTGQGFLLAEVSRSLIGSSTVPDQNARFSQIVAVSLFLLLFVLFAFMSWTFFYRIRKRLIRLQQAMTAYDEAGMPMPVGSSKRRDEVAALEGTFNEMVYKLRASRDREREEEELRKKLIANLSHDLRTPLTVIRSHAYSLESEPLGERGRESLTLMERKLDDLGGLIDNLLSYTLIAAGRYPMRLEETDVLRIVRMAAAQWYPVFEKEGMEVDADLPDEALIWRVDREWLVRILDNLFQNTVRHAKTGRYIGLSLGPEGPGGLRSLQVRDKGPGLKRPQEKAQPSGEHPSQAPIQAQATDGMSGAAKHAPQAEGSSGAGAAMAGHAPQAAGGSSGSAAADVHPQSGLPGGAKPDVLSPAAGAGIGLSIVDLMIREMDMSWSIDSGEAGTVITIWPAPDRPE